MIDAAFRKRSTALNIGVLVFMVSIAVVFSTTYLIAHLNYARDIATFES